MTNLDTSEKRFKFIANELNNYFPDLDLRFALKQGSDTIRFMVGAVSRDIHEAELLERKADEILHDTILTIKELAGRFDA